MGTPEAVPPHHSGNPCSPLNGGHMQISSRIVSICRSAGPIPIDGAQLVLAQLRQGTSLVRVQPVAIDYQTPNNRSVKVIGFVRSFDNRSVKVRQNACRL